MDTTTIIAFIGLAGGLAVGIYRVSVRAAETQSTAVEAHRLARVVSVEISQRVSTLEVHRARNDEKLDGLRERIDEVRGDVKELLDRSSRKFRPNGES